MWHVAAVYSGFFREYIDDMQLGESGDQRFGVKEPGGVANP